jgi:hypothetical protein
MEIRIKQENIVVYMTEFGLHRESGPAAVFPNGDIVYYTKGVITTEGLRQIASDGSVHWIEDKVFYVMIPTGEIHNCFFRKRNEK